MQRTRYSFFARRFGDTRWSQIHCVVMMLTYNSIPSAASFQTKPAYPWIEIFKESAEHCIRALSIGPLPGIPQRGAFQHRRFCIE